ncbi:conserved hypothetical protein [Candidatus Terasakiella magnetica]|uniref:General stress protein 17M-like domain-containing protein n=1 Tax=Candidatus Terasakiella magnetica TaxID=1867952 RepID=A0A1C3RIB9_9PROT|nr:hypothetical protein [Candidatus Terasakiella magnetica]SCA57028.1 conserved hypothetical protein [Candidatus Terasakiella magnetica]
MNTNTSVTEVVGLLNSRETFEKTVDALRKAGFERTDLSVLSSHESIEAAGKPAKPIKDVLTALVGEVKFEGPVVASGAVFLAGGPVGELIGAVVGATVGGAAIKEVLGEVTATPHTEDFARAVDAGSIILWVRALGEDKQAKVTEVLQNQGAENVHLHTNTPE